MGAEAWSLLQTIVSGLVGAGVVYYFGIRQLVVQRRLAFHDVDKLVLTFVPVSMRRRRAGREAS